MTIIEKPMLFSAPMVRAILEGRKTQTRRVVKGKRVDDDELMRVATGAKIDDNRVYFLGWGSGWTISDIICPHPVGSRIWVREAWCKWREGWDRSDHIIYRADMRDANGCEFSEDEMTEKWHPSIFMPRWASRITLEVTDVRVQRLQEISEDDARAEGCLPVVHADGAVDCGTRKTTFHELWNSINAKPKPVYVRSDIGNKVISHYISYPWEDINETRSHRGKPWYVRGNPWVWAYTFKQVQP